MKAKLFLGMLLIAGISFTSCEKSADSSTETLVESAIKPDASTATVVWTAYKTTEKVPVKGQFTKVTIDDYTAGDSWDVIVNGLKFSISSFNISTDDEERDKTIVDNFFEKMMDAGNISGEVIKGEDAWFVKLKMNGVTVDEVPATVNFEDDTVTLNATIELEQFSALEALNFLHEACYDLHMAGDGVSKTWDVVDVEASLKIN